MALFHTTVVDNQIKALDTIGTAQGSICTFDTDRAERLVNLEVAITATGGGGTPVLPIAINGFSACNLAHFGKQLFNFSNYPVTINSNGITWTYTSNGLIRAKGTATARSQIYVRLTQEQASVFNGKYFTNLIPSNMSCAIEQDSSPFTIFATNNSVINTITDNVTMYFRVNSGQSVDCVFLPTIVDTPNDITVNNISFGQTVYGGRLNVGSGVLTITHDIIDLGALSWAYDSTNKRFVSLLTNAKLNRDGYAYTNIKSKCSQYEIFFTDREYSYNEMISAIANENNIIWLYTANSQSYVDVKDTTYTDAPTFKTAMNGVKFVYELETPLTIQLDSKQIQTIANSVNNIYADTGDIIDLKFVLSVGQAIS